MNITGKIIEISDTAQVSSSFRKREFVVEYSENPQYPEFIKFELIQDKCDILDQYKVGEEVDVSFNLKGRKWTDPQGVVKYFNSLQAWRLAKNAGSQSTTEAPASEEPEWLSDGSDDNNLPF
jgi:hypothetical protein